MAPTASNSQALVARISAHDRFGSRDLNRWIWSHLALKSNLKILEIGCGTGKQTVPLAKLIRDKGQVIAVDISAPSITALLAEARKNSVDHQITIVKLNFDDLPDHHLTQVDRVLASFSLYYSKKPHELITYLYKILKPRGIMFVCGPSKNNNLELIQLMQSIKTDPVKIAIDASDFMEKIGLEIIKNLFSKVTISYFENPLRFRSAESLISYWKSYGLYESKLKAKFIETVKKYFQNNSTFTTVKRVIGITAIK